MVNNESADIIVMLNEAFAEFAADDAPDLYPEALREEMDELNAWVYDDVNNGVYKTGFAAKQASYEAAVRPLFVGLERLDERLGRSSLPLRGRSRPSPTGASSRRSCASTPSTSATSSAT